MTTKTKTKTKTNQPLILPISKGKILARLTTNSIKFSTEKTKVQTYLSIGQDSQIADLIREGLTVHVTIDTEYPDKTKCSVSGEVPLSVVLAYATNGIFEVFNTNMSSSKDTEEQFISNQKGFIYKSDYKLSLKGDEIGVVSLQQVCTDIWNGKIVVSDANLTSLVRNVTKRALKLATAPTHEQIALMDEKSIRAGIFQLLKKETELLEAWPWLEEAAIAAGWKRAELDLD